MDKMPNNAAVELPETTLDTVEGGIVLSDVLVTSYAVGAPQPSNIGSPRDPASGLPSGKR